MTSTCHCGDVQIALAVRPEFINDCNCSFCRKSGAAWGYFKPEQVEIVGTTEGCERTDKTVSSVAIHSCPKCHTTTHFELTKAFRLANPDVSQIGVNMRLFDPKDLHGITLYFPDGDGWDGELPYGFRRDGFTINRDLPL